jgi:hypothetical protein
VKTIAALFRLPVLVAAALVINGCSGRDTDLAEKLAAVEAAAARAEAAADRAEKAAKTAGAPPVVAMDAEPESDAEGDVIEDDSPVADSGPPPGAVNPLPTG